MSGKPRAGTKRVGLGLGGDKLPVVIFRSLFLSGICQFFQLTCILPSTSLPAFPQFMTSKHQLFPFFLETQEGQSNSLWLFFLSLPDQGLKEGIHPYCSEAPTPSPKSG